MRLLHLTATSAPTERSFSKHGFVHSKIKNRLKTNRASKIAYVSFNTTTSLRKPKPIRKKLKDDKHEKENDEVEDNHQNKNDDVNETVMFVKELHNKNDNEENNESESEWETETEYETDTDSLSESDE